MFKLHLNKYIFYYIIGFIILIFINYLIITLYNDYQINKKNEYDFSYLDSTLNDIYNMDPSLFKFNGNEAILEMNDLLKPITNGNDTLIFGEVPINKEQDQCVGYIIVKKINDSFKYDYSHICDKVDY